MFDAIEYKENVHEIALAYLSQDPEASRWGVEADDELLCALANDMCDHTARIRYQMEIEDEAEAELWALVEESDGEVACHMATFFEDVAAEAEEILAEREMRYAFAEDADAFAWGIPEAEYMLV